MNAVPAAPKAPFAAIIVAAGKAARFGGEIPKQYLPLAGKPMIRHSIDLFLKQPDLARLVVVTHPDHAPYYQQATQGLNLQAPVAGGAERQDSVRHALEQLKDLAPDMPVLIHDAARPCLREDDLRAVIDAAKKDGAATLAHRIVDTLRREKDIIDRSGIWGMQTPQAARLDWFLEAHTRFKGKAFTDDTALLTELGKDVTFVEASRENIKVTTADDTQLADAILRARQRRVSRIGSGFDVHAFGGPGPLRIGGIDIPHAQGLAGHSDADVVLHAINDALYGTLSSGDIGSHFPPSDHQWKGKDSAFFLEQAVRDVSAEHGEIVHVDITIICEAPKIGPYRDKMRERIAAIMGLPVRAVSVKATTTEKLGFTGRGEGIAVQVTTSVEYLA